MNDRRHIKYGNSNSGAQVAYNNGIINYNYQTSEFRMSHRDEGRDTDYPARQDHSLPRKPCFTVPFSQDPHYVDRPEFQHLKEKLSSPGSRAVLTGIGGVGKSQLAIEYCYRRRAAAQETWTFWIHASSAGRFDADVRRLAHDIGILNEGDITSDAFALLHRWLCDAGNGPWLLVLDNADRADFLLEAPDTGGQVLQVREEQGRGPGRQLSNTYLVDGVVRRPRLSYLPFCAHGSVLVTSRSKEVGLQMVDEDNIIPIYPMTPEMACTLLERRLPRQSDPAAAQELVGILEYMPLAISQAASYIAKRGSRCPIARYLAKLKKSEKSGLSLLQRASTEVRRDYRASNSILLTCHISFEHIRDIRRSAADLLSRLSFYDHQSIPDMLVSSAMSGPRPTARPAVVEGRTAADITSDDTDRDGDSTADSAASESACDSQPKAEVTDDIDSDDEGEEDLTMLQNYHLIDASPLDRSIRMHRLVQFALKLWLEQQGTKEHWQGQSMMALDEVMPYGEHEYWQECNLLYPHAKLLLRQEIAEKDRSLRQASVLHKAGWYAWRQGLLVEAEALYCQSARKRKRILGPDSEATLSSRYLVASVQRDQGRYEAAEAIARDVVQRYEKVLGAEHPNTLTSIDNLASVLQHQGRYEEAEVIGRDVVQRYEKVHFGAGHPNTLASIHNLASVLRDQGRYEEAEATARDVVERSKKVLGREHPNTLTSILNLASVLRDRGRYEEAVVIGRDLVERYEKALSREHPSTLASIHNLALALRYQGRYEEAERMGRDVVERQEKVLGREHPDTLASINNLGLVLRDQGKYEEAETIGRDVVERSERVLGREHPGTLASINNLGSVLQRQGRYVEAETIGRDILERKEKVLGREHPSTLISIHNLALVLRYQGRYEEAESIGRDVMKTRHAEGSGARPSKRQKR
ncbi:Tetratricopeptide repeat-containing protein 4 [Elsinoe fawcettii]|nr:Tetratricopeptide repeat-containing protein 4 [Elsinoe fawcettii]